MTLAVVPLLLLDNVVSIWEAAGLLVVAVGYTGWMIRAACSAASVATAKVDATTAGEAADAASAPKPAGTTRAALTAVVGLAVLLIGGHIFVDGAVSVAHVLGMSDRLVGLTIVAVGTSLPELVTTVIAARRGTRTWPSATSWAATSSTPSSVSAPRVWRDRSVLLCTRLPSTS